MENGRAFELAGTSTSASSVPATSRGPDKENVRPLYERKAASRTDRGIAFRGFQTPESGTTATARTRSVVDKENVPVGYFATNSNVSVSASVRGVGHDTTSSSLQRSERSPLQDITPSLGRKMPLGGSAMESSIPVFVDVPKKSTTRDILRASQLR